MSIFTLPGHRDEALHGILNARKAFLASTKRGIEAMQVYCISDVVFGQCFRAKYGPFTAEIPRLQECKPVLPDTQKITQAKVDIGVLTHLLNPSGNMLLRHTSFVSARSWQCDCRKIIPHWDTHKPMDAMIHCVQEDSSRYSRRHFNGHLFGFNFPEWILRLLSLTSQVC